MKHFFLTSILAAMLLLPGSASAQRKTDVLNRGIVSMPVSGGNFVSWRIHGEEYYDVSYNLYRNGALVARGLKVSNFTDKGASSSAVYTVAPVVRGVEQAKSEASRTASKDPSGNFYLPVKMQNVVDRQGNDITADYILNDVSMADLDGDGEIEFIIKRLNSVDNASNFAVDATAYNVIEAYKQDGTRLWWIDCGPNLVSGSSVELNIVAFDWDQDGKAECVMRGADNMIIHMADGTTQNVGNMSVNTRNTVSHVANMTYTNTGAEYLIYLNGQTGKPYFVKDYPLPRLEAGETSLNDAWGDAYGHRSTKHFFGAPYLDGRKPSLFIARGIYTRHRMVAFDINPATHELTELWRWQDNGNPKNAYFGQGNHNYNIADVDLDGRDEIVYGSMVIDHNGYGLSSTGLGHGDAIHTGDLDPYRPGLETFACNEDHPGNNLRDATTCEILYRLNAGSDDGRAMAGNFMDEYPGCIAASSASGVISCVTHTVIDGLVNDWNGRTPNPMALNFRIYWDGDLLEETVNSPGIEREAIVVKAGKGRIMTTNGCALINSSKNNPNAQGDILGDWREELILRTWDNTELRIYVSPHPTTYRIPTLWHDHQYRQAMCWQPLGYNQPPHVSYFVGETEGYTAAPPAFTMTGRTEIKSGQSIGSAENGKDIILCEMGNTTASVASGAAPHMAIFNVPSTVESVNTPYPPVGENKYRRYTYHTCNVTGQAFNGGMRLVKQGEGLLTLPNVEQKYTGPTDIWAGSVRFDGSLTGSSVWMNRHTQLISDGGKFRSVRAEYNAVIRPGTDNKRGDMAIDTLTLSYGAVLSLDLYGSDLSADKVIMKHLVLETKNWEYGPQYQAPVIRVIGHNLVEGNYVIGSTKTMIGSLGNVVVEVSDDKMGRLVKVGDEIILQIGEDNTTMSEGEFYLRNVATGEYLIAGSNWGTKGITGTHGLDLTFARVEKGVFSIDSKISNGTGKQYMAYLSDGSGVFMDQPTQNWKFVTVGENEYGNIYNISTGNNYLTASATPGGAVSCVASPTAFSQWQALAKGDLMKDFDKATPFDPADATFFLSAAGINRNDLRNSNWKWTFADSKNQNHKIDGDANVNFCAESFRCAFDCWQEVSVPNGIYRVSCQGFYRQDEAGSHPVLYANGEQTTLTDVVSEGKAAADDNFTTKNGSVYVPNSMAEAGRAFAAGAYAGKSVEVQVTDGKLRVGVKTTGAGDWVIFDNFELMYLGSDYTSLLASAVDAMQKKIYRLSGTDPFIRSAEAYEAFVAEISDLQSVIVAGGVSKAAYESGLETLKAAEDKFFTKPVNDPEPGTYYRIWLAVDGKNTGLNIDFSATGANNLKLSEEASYVTFVKTGTGTYRIETEDGNFIATANGNNSGWGLYPTGSSIVSQSNVFRAEASNDGTVVFHCANSTYKTWGWKLGSFDSNAGALIAPYKDKLTPTYCSWIVTEKEAVVEDDDDNPTAPDVVIAKPMRCEEAIYGIDGKRRASLQRGVNLIRHEDGRVTKILVK